MMKVLFASAVVLAALTTVHSGYAGGHSNSVRKQDDYGNFAFSYDIANGHGATNGRKESGGPHGVAGSYYIADVDGRHRAVHYVADKAGFRAQIKTNEPGTKTSYAAAAAYSSANGKAAPSGGLHGAAHYAGPVFAKAPLAYGHGPIGYGHGGHGHAISYGTHGVAGPVYGSHGAGFGYGIGHAGHHGHLYG
ncbi:hypothetical protein BIW11_00116 [Tropilaelaps mercedesae]|uniref:Adult-specific rigid cuticular protein 15.7-like n=1 Tax=Tropilaelaps mercedesae TaxID=418985 RepID=A0A1V9Y1W5_9ACAR|nr:hypothetical protein BIW11_00116 [Tropilaelaps mercedesae]